MRVALLYEHPTWSLDLLSRMVERRIDVTPINIGDPSHQPLTVDSYDLWVNRINIMPSAGRSTSVAASARHLLLSLEARGEAVFNGWRSHSIGASKISQYELFKNLGHHTPATVAVADRDGLESAAQRLGFPVLAKPNIGGSGAGIVRFDDEEALRTSLATGPLDLGVDGTGVMQQIITSEDGLVHRVEILAGSVFYATRQVAQEGVYNYCAADGCGVGSETTATRESHPIEVVEPSPEIADVVRSIVEAAGADVAGVEYLIDSANGLPCFYDFNPYSNFVVGQNDQLGFDPADRFIDAVLAAAAR